MTTEWVAVCDLDDLRNHGCREFSFEDERGETVFGFLLRLDDAVFAYRNSCPHLKIALNWMANHFLDYRGEHIQCALHGALFELETGYCVMGPCFGRSLEALPVAVLDNRITMSGPVKFETAVSWGETRPETDGPRFRES